MSGYGYRRGGYRASRPIAPGRFAKANARPGPCHYCGETVPAGAGQLFRGDGWEVAHLAAEWSGSPVSGRYINGCPRDTDQMNTRFGGRPEAERLADVSATYLAMRALNAPKQADPGDDLREVSRRAGGKYAYTSTGARMTMSSQRCEDSPCCGCCD